MIGFFDSGFGGLTVLRSVVDALSEYDYVYFGDNARVPYGNRSQKIVYQFTLQAVDFLFKKGCPLIIIACNAASAKALRRIQRTFLPAAYPERRVLGVIRPSVEEVVEGACKRIGILATEGVVASRVYITEIEKLTTSVQIYQQACPLLVPIVEAGERNWEGTDMIISKYLSQLFAQNAEIDTILLACTHYPLLQKNFKRLVPPRITILEQGPIVARKLQDYLVRHPEIETKISKGGSRTFFTTDASAKFDRLALTFFGQPIDSKLVSLG
ncbi:MAG: glutamate racemase [Deltaproteobacteria bacterium]|nr:glutamate racemase [Deltaproteobacteria bacterium]